MIIIERTHRYEVDTWKDVQDELRMEGIILPDYAIQNVQKGRPFQAPLERTGHYITVRYEPDAHR